MKIISAFFVAGLATLSLSTAVCAGQEQGFFEQSKAKPKFTPGDFKPAPGEIQTRFGTLEFPGGYPTEETAQKVYDELDLQRATQLYLEMDSALSAHRLLMGWFRYLGMYDRSQI